MHGRHEKFAQNLNLSTLRKDITGRFRLEDMGTDERIILKQIIYIQAMNLLA
jgi:hypothetical protein